MGALKCHAGRGGFAVGADVATNTTINRAVGSPVSI